MTFLSLMGASGLFEDVRVKVDRREHLNPGAKFYEWERKYEVEVSVAGEVRHGAVR